ncbi:MAG: Eco57I restriction-modification methylase domain-containing protein [Deltaproteobacteria bacterium]|nr:Eco57I restriction-modification methylase domain-containing protein [Deltaproteobacteria bacterium]
MPTYNGGLFISNPAPGDAAPEAEVARYLASSRISDRDLALALDWLGRDVDEKRKDLAFIDYKSLGVRQLGSIYEGLLEFKLRMAREPLAIVRGKRTEEYLPLKAARAGNKTILREGSGRDARERVIAPGEVYLENDQRERKATGSYYTPDFVVCYIVACTVGPVLDKKLDDLRPKLREAERWHREMIALAKNKGEKPSKYESGPAVEHRWGALVDEVFSLRVLDPAMGSGHFLVEAVDYVTDRLLDFLNGFGWNPVFAHAQHLRTGILDEMEQLGIDIDAGKLTDVNLLKRHVLKRCIFGVDINPMAVELAKVSLWLDCFTLGAPLSFLDHHLRRGNSLLGTTVKEVDDACRTTGHALLGSAFTGRKLAVDMMAQVGAMPDVTAAQVRESRTAYARAADALAAPARVLDVYFCRDVLDGPATEQSTSKSKKLVRAADSWAVRFLQEDRVSEYLWADDEAGRKKYRLSLAPAEREQLDQVAKASEARALFHWELGFPEVFYGPRPGTRQTIERLPEGGFDAVVGNPPWVRQEGLRRDKQMFEHAFPEVFHSEADLYVCFLGRSLKVLRPGGRLGMLVQNKWFKADYAERLRTHLASETTPVEVLDFGHSPLFPDADTFPCIVVAENRQLATGAPVSFTFVRREDLKESGDDFDLFDYAKRKRKSVAHRQLRPETWWLMGEDEYALMEKIRAAGVPLKKYVGCSPLYGIKTGLNDAFLVDQATRDRLVKEDPSCREIIKPFLRGENISRWQSDWDGQWMIFARRGIDIRKYPSILAHLKQFRKQLEPRPADWDKDKQGEWPGRKPGSYKWFELQDTIDYYDRFERPKIVYQDLAFHSEFTLNVGGHYANNTCYFLPTDDRLLLSVLNSALAWWLIGRTAQPGKDETRRLHSTYMDGLPIASAVGGPRSAIERAVDLLCSSAEKRQQETRQFHATIIEVTGGPRSARSSRSSRLSPSLTSSPRSGTACGRAGSARLRLRVRQSWCRRGARVALRCGDSRAIYAPSRSTSTTGSSIFTA